MIGISNMAASVQPSATLAAGAKARALKAEGIAVFDFSLGEPSTLFGLGRGMIDLEYSEAPGRVDPVAERVEAGAEDDNLSDAPVHSAAGRVFRDAAAQRDEQAQAPSRGIGAVRHCGLQILAGFPESAATIIGGEFTLRRWPRRATVDRRTVTPSPPATDPASAKSPPLRR